MGPQGLLNRGGTEGTEERSPVLPPTVGRTGWLDEESGITDGIDMH